jgi:hypothetical protein
MRVCVPMNHLSKPILLGCLDRNGPRNCGLPEESLLDGKMANFCLTGNGLGVRYVVSGTKWEAVEQIPQPRVSLGCERCSLLLLDRSPHFGVGDAHLLRES